MSANLKINIEVYQNLFVEEDKEGHLIPFLNNAIFQQHEDDACYSTDIPLAQILDAFIEFESVPGRTVTAEQRSKLLNYFEAIQMLITEKMEVVKNLPDWHTAHGQHEE